MVTYLYWFVVIAVSLFIGWAVGRFSNWKIGASLSLVALTIGWIAFYFQYEQLFVKKYGGVMAIKVPDGQIHLSVTWKDDHLWIENYDPKSNVCYFSEYSKGHMLQGQVAIENCNPMLPSKL